jgi:fused signal recognition particle receptor
LDAKPASTAKRAWWPLFSRHKARAGESPIGWIEDLRRTATPAPKAGAAARAAPEPVPETKPVPTPQPAPAPAPTAARAPQPEPARAAPAPAPKPAPAQQPAPAPPGPLPAPPKAAEPARPAETVPVLQPPPPAAETMPRRESVFERIKRGLARSTASLTGGITQIFTARKIDEATLQELEDLLISADLGIAAAGRVAAALREARIESGAPESAIRALLAAEVERVLKPAQKPLIIDEALKPHVVLVVGVNGTGKTTTIGKLAHKLKAEGKSVMIAAGDTFRAAAIDQLKVWGERTGSQVIAKEVGADAAGLAFEALEKAKASGAHVLLIDTAGRLQNKAALMAELEKITRVIKKLDPAAPHSVIQVLDATTGQNAISQVEVFLKLAGVTGLIMTKLDGTARGGILVPLTEKFGLPIHAIGVGEAEDDLEPFDAAIFARALAGLDASRQSAN